MIFNFSRISLVSSVVLLVMSGCAKIGAPSGGPKDVDPPIVVGSIPAMNATNFKGKKIEITFDEFVQLSDINKAFVVSPPMKKKPQVALKNKSVVVSLEEELKENSTYRFYFGNAIVDNNEKNPLKNYEFVFSTGNQIDSLSLRGRIVDAYELNPDKESYYVMLYNNFQDSVPRKQLPMYITKTDEKGWFSITHVKPDTFMIVALKDLNQNFLFDLPNEPIAYSDTLLHIDQSYFLPDSMVKADTTSKDSLNRAPFKSQIQLFSFIENHEKQYLKKYERPSIEKFNLFFNLPPDSLQITPLNFSQQRWWVNDYKAQNDTLAYWITDTSLVYKDTLRIKLGYAIQDSMMRPVMKYDTIALVYKKPVVAKSKQKGAKVTIGKFSVTNSVASQSVFDLNKPLGILPSHPLVSIDTSKIQLFKIQDEKKTRLKFRITNDSVFLRGYYLNFKIEPQTDYELITDTMAFTSIYEQKSDSAGYKFKSQKDDYYGKIKLTLSNVRGQVIVQLFKEKGNIVQQKIVDKNQLVVFDFLAPEKYMLKIIYDRNANKKWDTGNFEKRIQPEKVLFYPKEIPVRSNWDMEESWELE